MIADKLVGGNAYFVDSGATGITNNENNGLHPTQSPLATIQGGLDKASVSNGDFLVLMPGHAETLTANLAADIGGATILGIGNGDLRPTITVNAAIDGMNMTADNMLLDNVRIVSGTSVTIASRLMRTACSNLTVSNCDFEMATNMNHMVVSFSGDNNRWLNCTFTNTTQTVASLHPQTAFLNISGTNILVKNSRFNDVRASKADRWRACVEGGALASSISVEDCTFICRGQATSTRSAGASDGTGVGPPTIATLYSRAISPSGNTSVGTIFNMKYGYQVECYDVAAVNKKALISPTMA